MSRREVVIVIALCLCWYTVSSASNVVGKLVLTKFPFPMTVTMVQLLSTVVYSAPVFSACGIRREAELSREYYSRKLMPLAFAKFFTTVFSQISIWKVPISYAHTVKATTPLWTAGLSFVVFGERQSRGVMFALVLIAVAVALATATELMFDVLGFAAALGSSALLSLQHIYSKRVMRDTGLHHLRLLQILSRLALVMFLPVWLWYDGVALSAALVEFLRRSPTTSVGWGVTALQLFADGTLAWLQAVIAFSVLSRVSPLGYAMASAAKRGAVVLASLLVMGNPAPPANLAAMALAAVAVFAYSRAKLATHQTPLTKPLLPV